MSEFSRKKTGDFGSPHRQRHTVSAATRLPQLFLTAWITDGHGLFGPNATGPVPTLDRELQQLRAQHLRYQATCILAQAYEPALSSALVMSQYHPKTQNFGQ